MRWKGLLSQGKRRMDEGTKARLFLGAKSVDEPTKDAKFVSVDDFARQWFSTGGPSLEFRGKEEDDWRPEAVGHNGAVAMTLGLLPTPPKSLHFTEVSENVA